MKRLALVVLGAIAGYVAGAVAGYFAIVAFSSNTHDRSVEASMTGAFLFGPLGALVGMVVTFARTRGKV